MRSSEAYDPRKYSPKLLAASSAPNGGRYWQMLTLMLDPKKEGAMHINTLGHPAVLATKGSKAGAACADVANGMLDSDLPVGTYAYFALYRLFLTAFDSADTPVISRYDEYDKYVGFEHGRTVVYQHRPSDGIRWVSDFAKGFSERLHTEREGAGAFLTPVLAAVNGAKAERPQSIERYATWLTYDAWRTSFTDWEHRIEDWVEEQFMEALPDPDTGSYRTRRYFKWRAFLAWRAEKKRVAEARAAKRPRHGP